jgi:hypothetical protein
MTTRSVATIAAAAAVLAATDVTREHGSQQQLQPQQQQQDRDDPAVNPSRSGRAVKRAPSPAEALAAGSPDDGEQELVQEMEAARQRRRQRLSTTGDAPLPMKDLVDTPMQNLLSVPLIYLFHQNSDNSLKPIWTWSETQCLWQLHTCSVELDSLLAVTLQSLPRHNFVHGSTQNVLVPLQVLSRVMGSSNNMAAAWGAATRALEQVWDGLQLCVDQQWQALEAAEDAPLLVQKCQRSLALHEELCRRIEWVLQANDHDGSTLLWTAPSLADFVRNLLRPAHAENNPMDHAPMTAAAENPMNRVDATRTTAATFAAPLHGPALGNQQKENSQSSPQPSLRHDTEHSTWSIKRRRTSGTSSSHRRHEATEATFLPTPSSSTQDAAAALSSMMLLTR